MKKPAIPSGRIIGNRLLLVVKVRRTGESKRSNIYFKQAKSETSERILGLREPYVRRTQTYLDNYRFYASFKLFFAIRRGLDGISVRDVKIPRKYKEVRGSRYS